MLTVFFRSLTAATATAIAIVAPIRIINRPVGNHGTTLSTPMEGSCSKVLLLNYRFLLSGGIDDNCSVHKVEEACQCLAPFSKVQSETFMQASSNV